MTIIVPSSPKLQEALRLSQLGYHIFPLYGTTAGKCDCRRKDCSTKEAGKHPQQVSSWIAQATTSEKIIQHWWTKSPNANIAVQTGPVSGILVVDCDCRDDGDGFAQLQELDPEHRTIDEWKTVKARTGSGGYHIFFNPPDEPLTIGSKIGGLNIDLRCDGGYIAAPPSVNGAGAYSWLSDPADTELMHCPAWLIEFLKKGGGKKAKESQPPTSPASTPAVAPSSGLILQVQSFDSLAAHPGAGEGDRNATLCRLVGTELAMGTDPSEVQRLAMEWNQRCQPPKSAAGVRKSVQSIVSREWASMREKAAAPQQAGPTLKALPQQSKRKPPALITRLSKDVEEETLTWLWFNRFLTGHVNLLAGDPGLGKSLFAVDAAARVSTGRSWPDGSPCQQGSVIYCTTEDAFASVVKPRLSAADADHNLVTFVEGVSNADGEGSLFLDEHMGLLEQELEKQEGRVRLLILDTLQSYVGDNTNTSNNASSRRIMTPLKRLAEKFSVAVLALEHLTKGTTQKNATYRVQGSIAFTGAARSVWIVCKDPKDQNRRIVQAGKTNLSPDNEGLGLAYTIEGEVGRPYIVWGETNISTPLSELMAEDGSAGEQEESKNEFHRACEWLTKVLKTPMPQEDLQEGWKSEMLSEKTVRRAKKHLLIGSEQRDRKWFWMPTPTVSIGSEIIIGAQVAKDDQQ